MVQLENCVRPSRDRARFEPADQQRIEQSGDVAGGEPEVVDSKIVDGAGEATVELAVGADPERRRVVGGRTPQCDATHPRIPGVNVTMVGIDLAEVTMPAAKCIVSLVLLVVTLGAMHLGAEDHGESLGEPLFRLVRVQPEETEPVKAARTKEVDTSSRSAVVSFFNSEYTPSLSVPMQWTGNVATCAAGTTSQAYLDATFQMINFYRGMTGLVDVTNATSYNQNSQEAALIMSANNALSHDPPSHWTCWTSGGDAAAGASNLALGNAGPHAIGACQRG